MLATTIGALRQHFPKGTDLSIVTQGEVDHAADSLSTRPRQTLNDMTPPEKLAEVVQ
jgi:IS30 family transposase